MENYECNFGSSNNRNTNTEMNNEVIEKANKKHPTHALAFCLICLIIFFIFSFKRLDTWIDDCRYFACDFLSGGYSNELEAFFYYFTFTFVLIEGFFTFGIPFIFGIIACIVGAVCYESARKKEAEAYNEKDRTTLHAYRNFFLISVAINSLFCFLQVVTLFIYL